ncbi:MAG TPA: pitrilysin family protein, partial [Vicinamibacterales bacterium]|nr:pitrilysin family protein [Vicinamibacterales bacterium]
GSLSALDVSEQLARIGAQLGVDVGADAILVGVSSLTRFAERALHLMADIVVRPSLREDDFERVRRQRLNRLVQLRDMPGAIAERVFMQLLFGNAPYGHTPLGHEASIKSMTIDDIRTFHQRAFRPGDATLIAVGDSDHDTICRLAESAFGHWSSAQSSDVRNGATLPTPARLNIIARPGAPQSELRIGHVAVSRSTPDYHALVAANMVLGGQYVSRVNLNLRAEKGITYGVRTAFEFRRFPGPFVLSVSVDRAATALAISESMKEISDIREARPISASELAVGIAALTRGYAKNFETCDQLARAVAQLALFNLPEDFYSEFVPRIEALSPDEVTQAAARHLDPSRLTTLVVGDVDPTSQEFGRLGLGTPELLAPDSI